MSSLYLETKLHAYFTKYPHLQAPFADNPKLAALRQVDTRTL